MRSDLSRKEQKIVQEIQSAKSKAQNLILFWLLIFAATLSIVLDFLRVYSGRIGYPMMVDRYMPPILMLLMARLVWNQIQKNKLLEKIMKQQ